MNVDVRDANTGKSIAALVTTLNQGDMVQIIVTAGGYSQGEATVPSTQRDVLIKLVPRMKMY